MAAHFCFLLFLLMSFSVLTQAQISSDTLSLLEFKKGIVDDPTGVVRSTWSPVAWGSAAAVDSCPRSWHGVSCDESGSVITVALVGLGLSGELKFNTITGMRALQNLSLAGNLFTGRLVPAIGAMTSLQHLDLSGNHFYGPIPGKITNLWGLVHLNLSWNGFKGGFPAGFQNLQQLRVLDLRSNELWGEVGAMLSELRNVEHMDLSGNNFYGSLFMDSSNLSSLGNTAKYMNLSFNRLSGRFFSNDSMGVFKSLEVLDLGHNQLIGELPSFASLYNLKIFRARNNLLSGPIPGDLFGEAMQLMELDLSGNGFTESTPNRNARLSVRQRLKVAIDVARCLYHLHNDRRLPHGNLKPTNILLTGPDLTAKLADYGLHRLLTPSSIAEQMLNLGALGYGAPELATNKPFPSLKADVYSFGVILMELLTRKSAGDIISGQSGAVDLVDWVQMCAREGRGTDCFDRDIASLEEAPSVMDEMLAVSLKCVLPVNERPNIQTIFQELSCMTI